MKMNTKQQRMVLPNNYQEVVILKEMKFGNGERDIDLIRQLLFLYSIGMEYYDVIGNSLLYKHYCQRNLDMLRNPEVIAEMDKYTPQMITEITSLEEFKSNNNIFTSEKNQQLNRVTLNSRNGLESIGVYANNYEVSMQGELFKNGHIVDLDDMISTGENSKEIKKLIRTSFEKRQRKTVKDNIKNKTQNQLNNLEKNLHQFDEAFTSNIDIQKSSFEQIKQLKLNKMKAKQRKSRRFIIRKGSRIDDILISVVAQGNNNSEIQQNEILKGIMELSENKMKSTQIVMMKEIEDYIEKNMSEMHKALDELRISFEEEIKNVDEEVFPDVVQALKEDMENDLENLKEQYEEQRREGVEKIRTKYNMRK